jgi:uncharacterized protein YbjT (DUF2867 family)
MSKVLILGAGGKVARHVIDRLIGSESVSLTLYLRDSARLKDLSQDGISIIEADLLDTAKLKEAMQGQDLVYVNINGQEDELAAQVVNVMSNAGVKRLVFIAAIGIYDEVPGAFGEWNQQMIGPYIARYRKAADLIEASGLEYTILRPTWYTDKDEVDYTVNQKGELVTGTEISRKSVAELIVKIIRQPALHANESVALEKAGTEGDKPEWFRES